MPIPTYAMRIATFGDINLDVVLEVDDLPERGGEVFSTRRIEMLGGSAANTAAVLARLGLRSAVMGAVGDDDAGRASLHRLGSIGVDTDLASVSETHPTALNTILVTPDRERTMIGARGANVSYQAPPDWPEGVGWLHVSGYSLMGGLQQESVLQAIENAHARGIACSLDVPVGIGERIRDLVLQRMGRFRILTGSRHSLEELTESDDPVVDLSGEGRLVAMTSGAGTIVLGGDGGQVRLTPPSVEPVDVTGAGDAFAAGLIAGDVSSLQAGPTAVLAAAAGAAATLVKGASETLSDSRIWSRVLAADRWTDADASWLDAVRSFVGSG
jgi:ribokinase